MTPAARIAAAVDVLDQILAGSPAEKALVGWARRSRFAGSGDRAGVRDHVFDALRRKRSCAALGGGMTGRGLMIGLMRDQGQDPAEVFNGAGHAPVALTDAELAHLPPELTEGERLDCPDWLLPLFREGLGDAAEPALTAMRHRAPVFVRVNLRRASAASVIAALQAEAVVARPHPDVPTALEIIGGARKLTTTTVWQDGLIEVQDASSQAAVLRVPMAKGLQILDYCAGGGGKALALADRLDGPIMAHDIDPARMVDIPERARRAGVRIPTVATKGLKPASFDLVFCDAPCSGSGTWRRSPDAKWRLTPARLSDVTSIQVDVLTKAAALVRPGGCLAYATCSVFRSENEAQIAAFMSEHPGWRLTDTLRRTPDDRGDGFFLSVLRRSA